MTKGPLLESAYEECLAHELTCQGVRFVRQQKLPVTYKGIRLDCGYRLDVVIEGETCIPQGLLINFSAARLLDGLKSFLNSRREGPPDPAQV